MDRQCLPAGAWVPQNNYRNEMFRWGAPPVSVLGKLWQEFGRGLEFDGRDRATSRRAVPSLLQAVRKQVTFGSICHAARQLPTQAFAVWGF